MKERFLNTHFFYQGTAVGFKCDQVLLPNRKRAWREYLTHPGAAAVIPFLDSPSKVPLHKARVVMVRQFRYPVGRITEELPAGKLDGKESLKTCLARELREETGYSSGNFRRLVSYWPTPAFSNELIHIFWTEDLKKGRSHPDDDEFLRVSVDSFGGLLKKIANGRIRDSKTVIAVLAFAQFFKTSSKL